MLSYAYALCAIYHQKMKQKIVHASRISPLFQNSNKIESNQANE